MKRTTFLAETLAAAALAATPLSRVFAQTMRADYTADGRAFSIGNDAIGATWTIQDGALRSVRWLDHLNAATIPAPSEIFTVALKDGTNYPASSFVVSSGPTVARLVPDSASARLADRFAGTSVTVVMSHAASGLHATWRAMLRDGARYLRQAVTFEAHGGPVALDGLRMIELRDFGNALVVGTVDGSPTVSGNVFVALEHPFAQCEAIYGRVSATLPQRVPLLPGIALTVSTVVGVVEPRQLRRGFLDYVERERAHPYRTFLHYNSWYDLGYFGRYTAAEGVERIEAFGRRLHVERNVKLASFLFDDGWDDPNDLWHFNSGFLDGFAPLAQAAALYDAAPGAWLSPWGGYSEPRKQRLASAKRLGYEINDDGLALSGPKYFAYFSEVVENFLRSGVNQFKFDGTGDTNATFPGSHFGSDFDAAIALIEYARRQKPDVYVNLTTGTHPSPFWLRYCDSIWRGGYDTDFEGPGTWRQRWITYRDADTYAGIVMQGPLYPLNSLMLHGIVYARYASNLKDDPQGDFRDEVRSYFGTGTQLQELYVTPELLTERNWNDLALSARWSAANADVLRDTHWVGGDPARSEVYGWASWTPRKGILTLRNPSDVAQSFALDVASAFELPPEAPLVYRAVNPYTGETMALRARAPHILALQPYEVATLELSSERA